MYAWHVDCNVCNVVVFSKEDTTIFNALIPIVVVTAQTKDDTISYLDSYVHDAYMV